MLLKINIKIMGTKEGLMCCGRKNQTIKTIMFAAAFIKKYFFTHFFLLCIKNAAKACVGQAHNKL